MMALFFVFAIGLWFMDGMLIGSALHGGPLMPIAELGALIVLGEVVVRLWKHL